MYSARYGQMFPFSSTTPPSTLPTSCPCTSHMEHRRPSELSLREVHYQATRGAKCQGNWESLHTLRTCLWDVGPEVICDTRGEYKACREKHLEKPRTLVQVSFEMLWKLMMISPIINANRYKTPCCARGDDTCQSQWVLHVSCDDPSRTSMSNYGNEREQSLCLLMARLRHPHHNKYGNIKQTVSCKNINIFNKSEMSDGRERVLYISTVWKKQKTGSVYGTEWNCTGASNVPKCVVDECESQQNTPLLYCMHANLFYRYVYCISQCLSLNVSMVWIPHLLRLH